MSMQTRLTKPLAFAGLAMAAVFVVMALAATGKLTGVIQGDDAWRIVYLAMGFLMATAGNVAPKLRIFEHHGFPPARAIAAQRLTGWTLVMAGLAIMGCVLLSANRDTAFAASLIAMAAFTITAAAFAWLAFGPRIPHPDDEVASGDAVFASSASQAFGWIMLGLFWAFATFFVDYLWGDEASKWMTVGLSVIMPAIAVAHTASRVRRRNRRG